MIEHVIHRINAVFCGIIGVFSLFVAYSVARLAAEADMPPDEAALIPYVIAFCIVYGLACLAYAYCRFYWGRENNRFLRFFKKWPVYLLALAAHGLSLIWAVPLLFGLTDLKLWVSLPIGLITVANIFTDAAPYLKALGIWVKDALFTKKKK